MSGKRLVLGLVVVVGACGDDGVHALADAPLPPDGPSTEPSCPPVTGTGTTHGGSVATAETWTASGSPHLLPFDTSITAAVTIEKCAVVRIGGGKQVSVAAGGSITTQGIAGQPVTIEKKDAAAWVNIRTLNGGRVSFAHTTIDGGGDPLNGIAVLSGALDIAGTTPVTAGILHADHLTVTGSKSSGITLHDGGGFDATSTDVTISGSAQFAMATFARALDTIPSGTYTGNAIDEILVRATGGPEAMVEGGTIHERGVPYRIGYQAGAVLDVGPVSGLATCTIEPGVTLRFAPDAKFRVDAAASTSPARGALIAVGTAAKKITLTSASASPVAGEWYGLWLGGVVNPTTRLDHVRVLFAGKTPSGSGSDSCVPTGQTAPNDAAIRILGGEPATVFITNTEIKSSGFHGIDRGFRSDTKPDFLPTNDIVVTGCKQSFPRDINGACPTTPPCP